jgi:hypothetical protein
MSAGERATTKETRRKRKKNKTHRSHRVFAHPVGSLAALEDMF